MVVLSALTLFASCCLRFVGGSTTSTSSPSTPPADAEYLILDSSHDSPSITAFLMALEASSDPAHNTTFLGAITTKSPEDEYFRQIFEFTELLPCFEFHSTKEVDLYPVDGVLPTQAAREEAPDTVRFLLDSVAKYPGKVTIYSSGSLAAVSYAARVDPTFASNVKEIVVVGRIDEQRDTYRGDGITVLSGESPVLRDFEAFLTVLEEDFKNVRVMAPLDAVFSGPEVAAQVLKTLQEEMGNVDEPTWRRERPFAMIYLDSHLQRVRNGVSKAILMQEPGLAAILYPSLISGEDPISFEMESDPQNPELQFIAVTKVDEDSLGPSEVTSLITGLHENKFWDLLIRIRSRDWRGACPLAGSGKKTGQHEEASEASAKAGDAAHDEL